MKLAPGTRRLSGVILARPAASSDILAEPRACWTTIIDPAHEIPARVSGVRQGRHRGLNRVC